jgi:hypothetical protein
LFLIISFSPQTLKPTIPRVSASTFNSKCAVLDYHLVPCSKTPNSVTKEIRNGQAGLDSRMRTCTST